MNNYEKFNIDQISPVLSDLNIAKSAINSIINILNDYISSLNDCVNITIALGKVNESIINKIDKNVEYTMTQLNISVNESVTLNIYTFNKQPIFNRMHTGIIYRYKLKNGCLFENINKYDFESIYVDLNYNIFKFDSIEYFLSSSSNYFESFDFLTDPSAIDEDYVNILINKISLEKDNMLLLLSYLNNYLLKLNYVIDVTNQNIKQFHLF